MTKICFDTNCFIDHYDLLNEYIDTIDTEIVLSVIVLRELDCLKNNPHIGYRARRAIQSIKYFISKNNNYIFDSNQDPSLTNDLNIIMTAESNDALLITKDIGMYLLAKSFSVNTKIKDDQDDHQFTPYIIDDDPEFPFETFDLKGEPLKRFKQYISYKFNRQINNWDYYLTETDIFCYNPKIKTLECISKSNKYCDITVEEGVYFKPRDMFQKAAIYSIFNSDATLLLGLPGTGKSITAVAAALTIARGRKVFILRPTILSKKYDLGFLPGSLKDKLISHFSGILSSLYVLYGNTRTTESGRKGIDYDFIKEEIINQKFEMLPMHELHGLSIQSGDIIIVDEIQLLDKDYMSLLLSRICKGAKLIMIGDPSQSCSLIKNSESGLNKLFSLLPNVAISVVDLKHTQRNTDLSNLAIKVNSEK